MLSNKKINYKGLKTNLIRITKEESIEARKRFPNVHIAITSRGKTHNRKRYYLEENRTAMGWLKKYRMKGGYCYNEADFIDYLNEYVFPEQKSVLVKNLGWTDLGENLPVEYQKHPYFNF